MIGLSSRPASAATLDIQVTGLDLVYDGTDIYDATGAVGGAAGLVADADPLATMDFFVDGALVGSLDTDIYADVFIKGVSSIPKLGGLVVSAGNGDDFGFDLHTSAGGWGLALNLETATIFYTGAEISIGGGALVSSVPFQALPFGLVIDEFEDVTIAFSSANLSGVTRRRHVPDRLRSRRYGQRFRRIGARTLDHRLARSGRRRSGRLASSSQVIATTQRTRFDSQSPASVAISGRRLFLFTLHL